jgi:hypothetical protein
MMKSLWKLSIASVLWLALAGGSTIVLAGGIVTGDLKVWHTVTVSFPGPTANETDSSPNPFLHCRLQVTFTGPSGQTYNVPGFFDGDGKGSGSGNIWRVRFTPDQAGQWKYKASFRRGSNVAVDLSPTAGTPTGFNGANGTFTVANLDREAPGFLKWGRLEYVGRHYLKFRDGPYWIKGGTDSPENFFAYDGFDNTPKGKHTYKPHIQDWQPGDPDWNHGAAKGIIGALNYLASQRVNSIYFLPMNIGGDGKDTWPFVGPIEPKGSSSNDNLHYDISKLYQWETVFTHAQKKGICLHLVLNEAEAPNKKELDNATLGAERKLFYRELIARFGHHLALQWNLSEEYDLGLNLGPDRVKEFAEYIQKVDPYGHPITVHNKGKNPDPAWLPFLGDKRFSITSFQYYKELAGRGSEIEKWRKKTADAGRPLPICLDEIRWTTPDNLAEQRRDIVWPTFLSGGHTEHFLDQRLDTEDFRRYENLWDWTWYARRFMEENLPFWEMNPDDGLLSGENSDYGGGQVFAKKGEVYAIYLPNASPSGTLNLSAASGTFNKRWYNPRNGRFEGSTTTVSAGRSISLGKPPRDASRDWVILLRKKDDTKNSATTILRADPDNPAGRPGCGFKITYRWQAVPMDKDYTVFVHFADQDGKTVLQDDHEPPTPTSKWTGKVEYTRTVPLEQWQVQNKRTVYIGLAEGNYPIYVGLHDKKEGRKALHMGPGVTKVGDRRYKIGVLTINAKAPIPGPGKKTLDLTGYHLTFDEQFDELSVSAWGPAGPEGTRWIAHTPWKGDFGDARFTDPEPGFPFTVEDGILRIEARKQNGRWRSGLLSAVDPKGNGFKQKYGYFECRARFPKGPGTWPAFWLMGLANLKGLPGNTGPRINPEIDVVEHYGHWPWRFSYVLHLWGFGGIKATHEGRRIVAFGLEEDFHTYGVMIDEQYIILYFDGVEMHKSKTPEGAKTPLYPLVNLALGPGWPTDKTPNPSHMYVDYVKVWKKGKAPAR